MRRRPPAMPITPLAPGPGQESVWDYPRPPRVEPSAERVIIRYGGQVVAQSSDAVRVLETSHPPVYYLPRSAFAEAVLVEVSGSSVCEFKGTAQYVDLCVGDSRSPRAGWHYPDPTPGNELLRDRVAIFPAAVETCEVDGERVTPQEGGFYGGWITSRVVGPFKGGPGTLGW